jgi:hypothetical protein
VDAVGVIGLIAGLWLIAPGGRPPGRDSRVTVLGWVLTAFACALILSSPLSLPATSGGPDDPASSAPVLPRGYSPGYPLQPATAQPS